MQIIGGEGEFSLSTTAQNGLELRQQVEREP